MGGVWRGPRFVVARTRGAGRRRHQRGQAMVLALFAAVLVILGMFTMYSMGGQSIEKMKLQNTADAAAYAAALAEARDYNFSAYTNRAMVVNQVVVAQFVGLTSWFRNMSAFANNNDSTNWGREYYQVFFDLANSPLSKFYSKFLKVFGDIAGVFDDGKGGSKAVGFGITVFDILIEAYGLMQKVFHWGTALTVSETLGVGFADLGQELSQLAGGSDGGFSAFNALDADADMIKKNDPEAKITRVLGFGGLIYHLYEWFKFTETKDPNTADKDGPEADRFATVTMDSLDAFSRDRSTKPAWGFYFFYAPPLTYIDPYMFLPIPGNWGPVFLPVIHRGGTELKVLDITGGSAGASTPPGSDPNKDCHGNPTKQPYMEDYYSSLPTDSSVLCQLDGATITKGDASHSAGAYYWTGSAWQQQTGCSNASDCKTPVKPAPANPPVTPGHSGSGTGATTGNKSKPAWTAMDASSFLGLSILWINILGIPIPIPVPFAPPWMPVAHGGAYAGSDGKGTSTTPGGELNAPEVLSADNNFGVEAKDAYGGALDSWTTKIAAEMRQSKGAEKSMSKGAGLKSYMDISEDNIGTDALVGPSLLVEVQKPVGKMLTAPGVGQLQLTSGAPQTYKLNLAGVFSPAPSTMPDDKYMRALSKSQVYFARPSPDTSATEFKRTSGTDVQVEKGSLYNPYWQARLAPNGFWEQYFSMELHRIGL